MKTIAKDMLVSPSIQEKNQKVNGIQETSWRKMVPWFQEAKALAANGTLDKLLSQAHAHRASIIR